jgi:hypothetical protein
MAAAPCQPGDLLLRHEFWCEIESLPDFSEVDPPPPSYLAVAQRIKEEASFVYSGMLRGFAVYYVPSDKARGIAELIRVDPLYPPPATPAAPSPSASPGTPALPGLRIAQTRVTGALFRAYVEYSPDAVEARLYSSWRASAFPAAAGEGKARSSGGPGNRIASMVDGIKNAVREYARIQVKNKPKSVRALAAFERPPSISVREGNYVSAVRLKLKIEEIIPYAAY